MSISPNFFASSSGIGPQTGGFSPTPVDSISSSLRQNSSMGLMEYALYNDPRTRALSGLLATGLAGDPNQASNLIKNTGQGQLLKDISALAVSAGLVPGGSPTQLAANVQQMVATQGFSVGGNVGRNSPMFGGGALTDMMSRSVFDSVRDNFYDKVTALPKSGAHGMNMSQMGEAMGQLSGRGAFRGMEIGDLNIDKGGQFSFKIDKQKMEKVNKVFSDYAGMLKDARQVFGDLPMGELTQNAERLIGTSLREVGSVSAMRNRMANIQATSAAFGLNPAAVAERMMQVTDSVQMGMYGKAMQDPRVARDPHLQAITSTAFGRTASNISEAAVLQGMQVGHASTAAANIYAEQGKFMPVLGANEASAMLAQGMMEVASPRDKKVTGNVLAAQAMLSTGAIKDPKIAAQVQDLITKMGNTGDIKTQSVMNQQLATLVNSGGADIGRFQAVYSSTEMMNMMSPEATAKYSKFLKNTYSNRLVMEGTKNLNTAKLDYGLFREGEAGYGNREAFSNLIMSVDKKAQDALMTSVGANGEIDEEALNKAYETMPGLAKVMPKDKFKQTIAQLAKDPGRAQGNLKDQLTGVLDTARADSRFAAAGSARERLLADERAVQSYLSTTSLGAGVDPEDLGTEMMRGFFGTGKIDNAVVMASLKNKGLTTDLKLKGDRSTLNIDAAAVGKLSDTIGPLKMASIAKELNIDPSDKAKLAAALNTPEGFRVLKESGVNTSVNSDGTMSVASDSAVESETKELEMQSMQTAAERLLGKGVKVGGDLKTEEGKKQYQTDIVSELKKDKGKALTDLAGKFKANDYSGQEFESLRLLSASNPNIRKAITDSAHAANAEGTVEGKKKYTDLMTLDRKLASANGEGNKYLGVLEIMAEGLAQLKLYQE